MRRYIRLGFSAVALPLTLAVLFMSSCGKNNGTPRPEIQRAPSSSDANTPLSPGEDMRLADGSRWRAELRWAQTPAFSDEVFLEMTGSFHVRAIDGGEPRSITAMSMTADMPEHGHGTGSILPRMSLVTGEPGTLRFENLFFTMTGRWRIRVTATVDGRTDVWTTMVDVN